MAGIWSPYNPRVRLFMLSAVRPRWRLLLLLAGSVRSSFLVVALGCPPFTRRRPNRCRLICGRSEQVVAESGYHCLR